MMASRPITFSLLATELDLSNCGLREFPREVLKCTKLTNLDLSNNDIDEIPPEIAQLKHLERLYLDKNNLTRLPPELGCLWNLRLLSVNDNNLVEIPETLRYLFNLKTLLLSGNNLTSIPKSVLRLFNYSLNYLDCNYNPDFPAPNIYPGVEIYIHNTGQDYTGWDAHLVRRRKNRLFAILRSRVMFYIILFLICVLSACIGLIQFSTVLEHLIRMLEIEAFAITLRYIYSYF